MKRIAGIILIMVFTLGLFGCNKPDPNQLTLDRVVELSSKGEELTWSDFEQYEGQECGSGLYILSYAIDNDYELMIGGNPTESNPMYIYLVRKDGNDDSESIDIRREDVQAFIDGFQ